MNLESSQSEIQKADLDRWLLFDHHQRDPLACRLTANSRTLIPR